MVQKYDLVGDSRVEVGGYDGDWVKAEDFDTLTDKLKKVEEELSLWQPIIDEIDRRANKTGVFDNREDFTVTVNIDDYLKAYFGGE